jgi:putative transposase
MLIPNNVQQTKMFQTAGCVRFAYNWTIAYEQQNYESGGKFISDVDLRRIFTQMKHQEEYAWLNSVSNDTLKQSIKDACLAYKRFFQGNAKYPRFKSKHQAKLSFYVDTDMIEISETHVKLEKIADSKRKNRAKANWVRLAEHNRIPTNAKYSNPRVTFDGLHWWLSVGVDVPNSADTPTNQGIGIDLGVKDLAICSDGYTYKNINKSRKMKKLARKKRRLQRKVSKRYQNNRKGGRYIKTRNIIKSEKQLLRVSRKLTNIRQNYIHQTTSGIVSRKPKFVVLEDLNVYGMMKNRHLAKAVQDQGFYEFRRQIEYKCTWNNILLIIADRFFPSSKTCSCCGAIKRDLTLKDRVFICPECGFTIDRDLQAAINLAKYGEKQINNVA